MSGEKILAVCQSGGEFVKNSDGSMFYSGGEAHAIDINRDMPLNDLISELSSMFSCRADTFSIRYFLPNNRRTPITVSSDKDLQRMVDFHGDSLTTDIFVVNNSEKNIDIHVVKNTENRTSRIMAAHDTSRRITRSMAAPDTQNRITRSVVADSDTPSDSTSGIIATPEEAKRQRLSNVWDNLITDVGQTFADARAFRDALQNYAIAKGFTYKLVKNEKKRVSAICTAEGCPWRIYSSSSSYSSELVVRKLNNSHTCGGKNKSSSPLTPLSTRRWITSIIKDKLQDTPNYKPNDIKDDLQREYGLYVNYSQARRGKFRAEQELHNSHEKAGSQLTWYCKRILETNPGSVATLEISVDLKFHLFIALHASLSGFEHGCRPLLFLDGISLKANKQWKLLTANAVDGDSCLFPVCFSVVDAETEENWNWFLMQMKSALSPSRTLTFISTRENGLEGVTRVFEDSYHGYCVKHLTEKFKTRIDEGSWTQEAKDVMLDNFQQSVYACKADEFNKCIEIIKAESLVLSEWILGSKPELWSNAFFKGLRYDQYSLNASEMFNSWISAKSEPSVVQIVDMIRCKVMETVCIRRQSSNAWTERLTPSANKKVNEAIAKSRNLDVISSSDKVFEVRDGLVHVVCIKTWECTCRVWQVSGLPCVHALAALEGECVYDYCSNYFTTECYRLIYAESVFPIPDDADRPASVKIIPMPMIGTGRAKRTDLRVLTKAKQIQRCSACEKSGHNKKTCPSKLSKVSVA